MANDLLLVAQRGDLRCGAREYEGSGLIGRGESIHRGQEFGSRGAVVNPGQGHDVRT